MRYYHRHRHEKLGKKLFFGISGLVCAGITIFSTREMNLDPARANIITLICFAVGSVYLGWVLIRWMVLNKDPLPKLNDRKRRMIDVSKIKD